LLGPTSIDRWCYATSKAAAEHFCLAYRRLGLPITVLRYFNVYGPRLDRLDVGRVITIFLGQLLRGEPLTVIGDGSQTRCFTFIDDVVRATVAAGLLSSAAGQIINVGTHDGLARGVPAIAELLARCGVSASFFVACGPDRMGRRIARLLDPRFGAKLLRTRAVAVYGWRTLLSGTLLPSRPVAAAFP